ncbi:P-loop containing nucleoside triphosphate hydrolase protein [Cytidiella melzeri]|nr:P-loop containing nucleoside triphosphate hydrolase protein [Cytidiella melzeri]
MTIVVAPTNALEDDMVRNLAKLNISAIALNSEALESATLANIHLPTAERRDLWKEAREGQYRILLMSPEMLQTKSFRIFIENANVHERLALFVVDECHLVDEWGADFRKAYGEIHRTIPWLPPGTARLGLTATLEPQRQTDVITKALGFQHGNFFLERRDCERRNVDIVMRTIEYTHTTEYFRDLDWLVPADTAVVADIDKTLLYCETISQGHKIVKYLRSLLPRRLQPQQTIVIRHVHSLNCPHCKVQISEGLYVPSEDRQTAIYVATDVLGVGRHQGGNSESQAAEEQSTQVRVHGRQHLQTRMSPKCAA